jgi:hypothetical protein
MVEGSLERNGFTILPRVLTFGEIDDCLERLNAALEDSASSIRNRQGVVYAARNVIDLLPNIDRIWRTPVTSDFLAEVLGKQFVLVRTLFFDKHPERSWTLPWHKDMTIAVKDNSIKSSNFTKPTQKLGVPHVEAPTSVLQNMLTLRFHLDDVTEDNGPLEVIPGTHLNGKQDQGDQRNMQKILVSAGDVLAMRPLLSHASGKSKKGTRLHRRILHFEFSGDPILQEGFQWYYDDASS